ncbi:MAG: MaoC family dehydratase, partial [Dehalococcoidia bacterium]
MTTEKIYEWDVAREGDESPPFMVEVTQESIADYCNAVRYDNPVYLDDEAAKAAGFPGIIAPPTMVFSFCPMRRVDFIKARGYIAPEQSDVAPRSTPYTSGDVKFLGVLVRPGDVISSTVKVHEKYERKGNK